MNWLTDVVRPKIRNMIRRETPENLWIKCPDSGQLVFYKDVEANQFVIPGSNYHMRMGATARLKSVFDNETWFDVALPDVAADPLPPKAYADRVRIHEELVHVTIEPHRCEGRHRSRLAA